MKKYGFKRMISMILAAGMVAAMAGCGSSSTSSAGGAGADDASGSDKTQIVLLLNGYLGELAFDEPIEGVSNVYSMSYNANEGSFLAGMAAASVSESGVIGFIGGEDSTVVNDSLVGYLEGAAYVNPDIKAIVSYTGNWDDSAKGKELALVQYNAGADVVFQLASNAGVGVFEAAKETGKLAIGSDTDQSLIFAESDPDKAAAILTSSLKRVDTSLLRAYELYKQGQVPYGTCEKLGLDKECVGIVENDYFKAHVSEEDAAAIAQAKQDIIDGKITVSSSYGMTTEELAAFKDQYIK